MFILPFLHKQTMVGSMQLTTLQLLTIGRHSLWAEESELDLETDILHPNGIYLSGPPLALGDTWLCPVDASRTHMDDFYRWEERAESEEVFVWKTVYLLGTAAQPTSGLSPQERLGPHRYEEIMERIRASVI